MILLSRNYLGYVSGSVVQFATSTETSLVAQGYGTITATTPAPGAVTVTANAAQGRAVVAAAAISVVVTHPGVTAESKINAYIAQATADTTAAAVVRVVPAVGSFTIFVTAAATAAVQVDWSIATPVGLTATN